MNRLTLNGSPDKCKCSEMQTVDYVCKMRAVCVVHSPELSKWFILTWRVARGQSELRRGGQILGLHRAGTVRRGLAVRVVVLGARLGPNVVSTAAPRAGTGTVRK